MFMKCLHHVRKYAIIPDDERSRQYRMKKRTKVTMAGEEERSGAKTMGR